MDAKRVAEVIDGILKIADAREDVGVWLMRNPKGPGVRLCNASALKALCERVLQDIDAAYRCDHGTLLTVDCRDCEAETKKK